MNVGDSHRQELRFKGAEETGAEKGRPFESHPPSSLGEASSRKSRGRQRGSGLAHLSSGVFSVCFRDFPVATEGSEKNRKRGACKLKEKMLLGNRRGWGWQREPRQGGRQGVGEASEKVLTVPSQIGEPWWVSRGVCGVALFGGEAGDKFRAGASGQAEGVGYSGWKVVCARNKITVRLQPFFFFF